MKRVIITVFIAVLVINVGIFGYLGVSSLYKTWGRRLIYSSTSTISKYPGGREITQDVGAQIFLSPNGEGIPFFDLISNRSNYSNYAYQIIDVPAQTKLSYAVGIFRGWQDIAGTDDKYVLIYYPFSKTVEKFRLDFSSSGLFKDQTTTLGVEDVKFRFSSNTSNSIKMKGYLTDLTYNVLVKIINKGDAIIVIPVIDPPQLSKKDEDGNYLASQIIIRRIDGITELNRETK